MILETEIIKVHQNNPVNQSSDNWKAATRSPAEALQYEQPNKNRKHEKHFVDIQKTKKE